MAKFEQRVAHWASNGVGLQWTIVAYRTHIQSVLRFPSQLCLPPPDLAARFQSSLRRLVPGPGNWIAEKDLVNLSQYGCRLEFPHPAMMAMSVKLMVSQMVVANANELHDEFKELQSEIYRRPFGQRHYSSFATILFENERELRKANVIGIGAPRTDVQGVA